MWCYSRIGRGKENLVVVVVVVVVVAVVVDVYGFVHNWDVKWSVLRPSQPFNLSNSSQSITSYCQKRVGGAEVNFTKPFCQAKKTTVLTYRRKIFLFFSTFLKKYFLVWLALLAVFIIFVLFCHQVVHFIHLVFRQTRALNSCPRTMAQTVSPWHSQLNPFNFNLIHAVLVIRGLFICKCA